MRQRIGIFVIIKDLINVETYLSRSSELCDMSMKGITPVIAIVLLLLVTVGAVGVVYSQFQDLVRDDVGADYLENIDDIEIQTVVREEDNDNNVETMELRIQNSGSNQYNLNEVARMAYRVPGEQQLDRETATDVFSELESGDNYECFPNPYNGSSSDVEDIQSLGPGDVATCDTGVSMPGPNDEVELLLLEDSTGEEIDSYTCSPRTESSATC